MLKNITSFLYKMVTLICDTQSLDQNIPQMYIVYAFSTLSLFLFFFQFAYMLKNVLSFIYQVVTLICDTQSLDQRISEKYIVYALILRDLF